MYTLPQRKSILESSKGTRLPRSGIKVNSHIQELPTWSLKPQKKNWSQETNKHPKLPYTKLIFTLHYPYHTNKRPFLWDKITNSGRSNEGSNYWICRESRASRSSTAPSCPLPVTPQSGVRPPYVSGIPGSAFPRRNSSLIVPSWPFLVAHESGVWLYSASWVLGLTSSRSTSSLAIPCWDSR